jgi:hypothetical protein
MSARQAQLNALLDLDKKDHQGAPPAEDDSEPRGEIVRLPLSRQGNLHALFHSPTLCLIESLS